MSLFELPSGRRRYPATPSQDPRPQSQDCAGKGGMEEGMCEAPFMGLEQALGHKNETI